MHSTLHTQNALRDQSFSNIPAHSSSQQLCELTDSALSRQCAAQLHALNFSNGQTPVVLPGTMDQPNLANSTSIYLY